MSDNILHQQILDNGLELVFINLSNRYFGDYHQIRIDVVSRLPLTDELLIKAGLSEKEQHRARKKFGGVFESHQEMKRMGVAGSDVSIVLMQMVRHFLDSSLPYLDRDDFPIRLLHQRLIDHPHCKAADV